MKHLLDVIYYQLFRFYNFISIKRIVDPDPHETTIVTFGIGLGWFFYTWTDIIWEFITGHRLIEENLYGSFITWFIYIFFLGGAIFISYKLFQRKKHYLEIVKQKPLYKNNINLSIMITLIYIIISFGAIFFRILIIEPLFFNK